MDDEYQGGVERGSLAALCRREPEWAASQIRRGRETADIADELRALVERIGLAHGLDRDADHWATTTITQYAAGVAKAAEAADEYERKLMQRARELSARVAELEGMQSRVWRWVASTFGEATAADVRERSMRFVEEALELAQSVGMSDATAHRLVDFVWGRPAGNPRQEVGGTMVTLLTLAEQHGIDVLAAALTEIARIETPEMVAKCRRHQAQKEAQGMASDTGAESEE